MAIINGERSNKKIKAIINNDIAEQIEEYCQWANITNIGFFIEEAASYVFSKDKDWKAYQRTLKRLNKKKSANTLL